MKRILIAMLALSAAKSGISGKAEAIYDDPVAVYNHNIFATPHEYASIHVPIMNAKFTLPQEGEGAAVFEGLAPIWYLDHSVMVVATESDLEKGARLALYGWSAQSGWKSYDKTEPIGTRHRWLALSWFGDMDANGHYEVGYVETPHLAGTLKLYEIVDNKLVYKAELPGISNHKIGEDRIYGGPAICGDERRWFVPDHAFANWLEVSWDGKRLSAEPVGAFGAYPQGCIDDGRAIHGRME